MDDLSNKAVIRLDSGFALIKGSSSSYHLVEFLAMGKIRSFFARKIFCRRSTPVPVPGSTDP